MRARTLAVLSVAALALGAAAWWSLDRRTPDDAAALGPLLPGFGARIEAIDGIEVVGAGDTVLVRLAKVDGQWRMPDRLDWPGNQREISRALFRLAQAQRIEAKTALPERHARLGVEDVASPGAGGAELRLTGGGEPVRIVVGSNHPSLGGSHVRLAGEAQAWLLDEDIAPAREPAAWLDRRLVDLPLARIAAVAVAPAQGRAFRLAPNGDRFTLDGGPAAAMGNPEDGNATASVPDQLVLDDVAKDAGQAASQRVRFDSVDGVTLEFALWRDEAGTWARLAASLDEARALAWFERAAAAEAARAAEDAAAAGATDAGQGAAGADETESAAPVAGADVRDVAPEADEAAVPTPSPAERVAALRDEVAGWQARFNGKVFLLPPYKAANLIKTREDYLAGSR